MAQDKATQQAFEKLNVLESAIVNAEDSAEDARWHQAEIVKKLIDDGATLREIAGKWTNARTGKPYTHKHVDFAKQVWERWGVYFTTQDAECPDWTTAYYTAQQRSDEIVEPDQRRQEWTQAHEARAPRSEEAAEKLVQNLLKESPDVVDTVYQGLREGREDRYIEPKERERREKEADTFARDKGAPIMNAFSTSSAVLLLEQALEELKDATAIDGASHDRIVLLIDEIRTEAEVKHAMQEIR